MKNKELAHYVKWVATTITLLGAVLASLNIYPYSAITLNIGAGLFLIWAILVKDRAMITEDYTCPDCGVGKSDYELVDF